MYLQVRVITIDTNVLQYIVYCIGYHVSTDVLKISFSYLRSPTGGKAYGIPKKACPLEVVRPTILPYLVLTVKLQITAGTMLIHTLNISLRFHSFPVVD
jgi:hypothetical protein